MKLPREKTTLLWESALREVGTIDPESIVWLYQLARRVYRPDGVRLAFARAPIHVGGVWLYPITLARLQWLEAVSAWWGSDDLYPIAYACACSHGAEIRMEDPTEPEIVRRVIVEWRNSLQTTAADLNLAVCWLLGDPTETVTIENGAAAPSGDTRAQDWGEILCLLAGAYHLDPWTICMKPVEEVLLMIDNMPTPQGAYGAPTRDQRRKTALAEFQTAVRTVKAHNKP